MSESKKLLSPLTLGSVTLPNRIFLAPMAGVSDVPFRLLCHEMGAGLVCSEMVSAKAITYKNRNTVALLQIDPAEHPVSLQIFGSEPEVMAEAVEMIRDVPYDILDVNMGCPVPKVAGNGEGSALMKKPELVEQIVSALTRATEKPVTIKTRKGFDEDHVNAVEVALAAQEGGAAAVAIHGRTREQYYAGQADWSVIARVKEALDVPVFGNGDVIDPQSALALAEETRCDAILIGRAARGNPWLFQRTLQFLETGEDPGTPTAAQIRDMILRHARMEIAQKGESIAIRQMRGHVAWYTTGLKGSSKLRAMVNEAKTYEELESLLTEKMQ